MTHDPELEQLVAALRADRPDLSGPPAAARVAFEEMRAAIPVAPDLTFAAVDLGAVPGLKTRSPGAAADAALLYLHGGGYVIGSAQGYRGLAAELARAAGVTGYAIDYRRAPEHPCPAAVDDAVAAYRALLDQGLAAGRIVLAGDSAGGGLTVAALVAIREAGLPQPAAALALSPWSDLACTADSLTSKAAEDPSITAAGLRASAALYLAGADPAGSVASPVRADLSDLAPLLIQVGSAEVLLDDSLALARAAGAAGTSVRLEVWPGMIHVWHAFGFRLAAGRRAIAEAGAFLAARLGDSA